MTETNTPAPANDAPTPAPTPETFNSSHRGLREAAREYGRRDEEESTPTKVEVEGDAPLTPRQGAEALSKWRSEREADRKALDDALGLNAPAEDAESSEEETSLVAADRKLQEVQAKFDKDIEDLNKRLDDPRQKLTESADVHTQLKGAVADAAQLFQQEWTQHYPDIASPADLAALKLKDPVRAAQAEADLQRVNIELATLNQYQTRAQEKSQQAFQAWANNEDAMFSERFKKELSNPKVRTELTEAALGMLKAEGFSQEQIVQAWNGSGAIPLRAAAVQAIMMDAARYRLSQQRIKDGKARPAVPQVVRPGVASGRNASLETAAEKAMAKLDKTGSVRDAARALTAMRRARR